MDFYLGYVTYYAFNYAPQGWAQCNGQLLQITTNQALYSLLGVMYGGDGRTTFALPDLRGRTIVGMGQHATNQPNYVQGKVAGAESVALTAANMPAHSHSTVVTLPVNSANGDEQLPFSYMSQPANGAKMFSPTSTANAFYAPLAITVQPVGGAPVPLLTPYQVLNACICTSGLYPSRG